MLLWICFNNPPKSSRSCREIPLMLFCLCDLTIFMLFIIKSWPASVNLISYCLRLFGMACLTRYFFLSNKSSVLVIEAGSRAENSARFLCDRISFSWMILSKTHWSTVRSSPMESNSRCEYCLANLLVRSIWNRITSSMAFCGILSWFGSKYRNYWLIYQ